MTTHGYEPYVDRMVLERGNKFTLMLSDEEKQMLESLAEANGFDSSNYLRGLIRREASAHAEPFPTRAKRKVPYTVRHRDPAMAPKRVVYPTKPRQS